MQLIIGPASSGKSTRLMQHFQADLDQSLDSLLIVPTRILKDKISTNLAIQRSGLLGRCVMTLSQLIEHIIDSSRYARTHSIYRISSFESYLMIKLIIEKHSPKFVYFKNIEEYPGLIRMIFAMVQEMRSSTDYFCRSLDLDNANQRHKWQDLQKILSLYVDHLEHNDLYDSYRLHRLASTILKQEQSLSYDNIFLDGFYDYTSYQLDLLCDLGRLVESGGHQVMLTVPDIPFPLIQDTLTRLRSDFNCQETIFTDSHVYSQLGRSILDKSELELDCEIQEIQAFGAYREVEQVANQISRLTAQEGYHYRDIAVITRDPDKYQKYIHSVFRNTSHPYFPGRDELLKLNPLIIFIRTIIRFVVQGIDNAGILSLINSGYLDVRKYGILSRLNDFFSEYIRSGKQDWITALRQKSDDLDWEQQCLDKGEFSRFKSRDSLLRHRESLTLLDTALTEVLEIIFQYDSYSKISGDDFVSWIASLLSLISLESSRAAAPGSFDLESKDYMAMRKLKDSLQSLRKSLQVLDMPPMPFSSYFQLFDEMIRDVRYRYRYYTRDSVSFLTPYDAREQRFKVVFILGLNEGEFPGGPSFTLSDDHERRQFNLKAQRILLEDESGRISLQLLELYTALTRSSDKLYLCHTPFNETGKQLLPSMYLEAVRMRTTALSCIPPRQPGESYSSYIFNIVPSSDWMALYELTLLLQYDGHRIPASLLSTLSGEFPFLEQSKRMLDYYRHREGINAYYQGRQPACPSLIYVGEFSLDQDGHQDLPFQQKIKQIIKDISWSPKRIEMAGTCRYKFFWSAVLGIQASPIPKEEIKSDLKGLFFHKVLELYVQATEAVKYDSLPDIHALSTAMDDARKDMAPLLRNNKLFDLEWYHYYNVLKSFVYREKELRLDGRVEHLEHALNQIELKLDQGRTLTINGRIDRVDKLGDKIRVIDYKSSSVRNGKPIKAYIRPLFVNQGILYARALDSAVADITYISIEKNEIMDLLQAPNRKIPALDFPSLWDQKSRELSHLIDLLESGDFKPWHTLSDLGDRKILEYYTPYLPKGIEMESGTKCSYCDYIHACPRAEKKLSSF